MNSFLRKFKPVFRNNRVSIVMILLMLTILILGISKSGLFSRNVQAQAALKTSAEKPIRTNMAIYDISAKDLADVVQPEKPQIITNCSIPLGIKPVRIIRGPDLGNEFGLYFSNGTSLDIRPKTFLSTPIMGEDDLLKVPRIKGVVARVICETAPITAGDLFSVSKETLSIWKFPIQIVATEETEINSFSLTVKSENFLYLGLPSEGGLFPSPVIERDNRQDLIAPQDGLEFLIQNVFYNSEQEILAPPLEGMPLPGGVDSLFANKFGEIELSLGEKTFTLRQPGSVLHNTSKFLPSVWGKIKK